jgi:hypothetical protein
MNRTPATAALLIALSLSAAHAEPVVKFPNRWAYYRAMVACLQPYFECDYTTKTWLSGHSDSHGIVGFVGVVPAEDRQTVPHQKRPT